MKRVFLLFSILLLLTELPVKINSASIPTGYYKIVSALSSNKVIDINEGSHWTDGTKIQLWTDNGTGAQSFYLEKLSSGYYTIRSAHSGYSLDVPGSEVFNSQKIHLWSFHGGDNQQWKLVYADNGYYYIETKLAYKYLDAQGGETADGTSIILYYLNKSNAQRWKIETRDMYYALFPMINKHFENDCSIHGIKIYYGNEIIQKVTGWFNIINRLLFLFSQFNHAKKYDIKRENLWNSFFDVIFPGVGVSFKFDGVMTNAEHLGNFIYGYIGRKLGFSDRVIFQGGGYAASGLTYLHSPENYYGDSEDDHYSIDRGMRYAGSKEGPLDFDLYQLAVFPEALQHMTAAIKVQIQELLEKIKGFCF